MRLLPHDSFTLHSPDSLPRVVEKLARYIEPVKAVRWSFSRDHAPYQGTISDNGFEMHRIIHHRNSFLPVIRGRFEALPQGTAIHISMGMHPFVIVFLLFWYVTWYSVFLPLGLTGSMPQEIALLFLGLPLVAIAIFWGSFWYEVKRSRSDLRQMVLGEPVGWQRSGHPILRASDASRFNTLQIVLTIIGLGFFVWQISTINFLHTAQPNPPLSPAVSCADNPSRSPSCQFSVIRTITGHPTATAIALSNDGQTLVTGGEDKAIKVWDVSTGALRKTFQSDSGKIQAVAIAPDGKTVVSGSADHMVRIWDLTSKQPVRMLSGHPETVSLVGITPDDKTIISASFDAIKLWDLASGKLQATLPNLSRSTVKLGPVTVEGNDPNNFRVMAMNAKTRTAILDFAGSGVKVWDLATNQVKFVLREKYGDFAGYLISADISPDGKLAAMQYSNSFRKFETRLKIWDLTTGQAIAEGSTTFSHDTFINVPLTLSNDRIFGSDDGQLKVWNLQTAQPEAALTAEWMSPLVVSSDGKLLAGITGDPYYKNTQIKIWSR